MPDHDTPADTDSPPVLHYRTVWISDLHLGTPGCQAAALLDFLRDVECDTLYLVGDIIDGWQLRRSCQPSMMSPTRYSVSHSMSRRKSSSAAAWQPGVPRCRSLIHTVR